MKTKKKILLVILILLLLAVGGFAVWYFFFMEEEQIPYEPDSFSFYFENSGQIEGFQVEEMNDDSHNDGRYTEEGLLAYVEGKVKAYNVAKGAAEAAYNDESTVLPVAVKQVKVENSRASIWLIYATAEDYMAFNEDYIRLTQFRTGTISEILDEYDGSFTEKDGDPEKREDILEEEDALAVLVEGDARLQFEGKILYISEGVTLIDNKTVQTGDAPVVIIYRNIKK